MPRSDHDDLKGANDDDPCEKPTLQSMTETVQRYVDKRWPDLEVTAEVVPGPGGNWVRLNEFGLTIALNSWTPRDMKRAVSLLVDTLKDYRATANVQQRRTKQGRYRIEFVASVIILGAAVLVIPEGVVRVVLSVVLGAWPILGLAWIFRSKGWRDR